jgi:hypothetical protein
MADTVNYSSIYDIKETVMDLLAPKYFNMDEVNDLNIGLLGYVTDMIGNIADDTFNVVSTLMNEMFINTAVLPESIYNYASIFQIDTLFATPAELKMMIGIAEDDIIRYGTKISNDSDIYEFYIDSDMIIDVEDRQFSPDYDIKITFREYNDDIIYTAVYDMNRYGASYTNSISNITNPYINIQHSTINNKEYLLLLIQTHQVVRYSIEDTIINNNIINYPTFNIEFDGNIANMEIFYKESGSNETVQLIKKVDGAVPVKTPFCYYKFKDENIIEISFSVRDGYFQPKYNSSIYIDYMLTNGSGGNFAAYTGNLITVSLSSDVYEYNSSLSVIALPIDSSVNGTDKKSLDDLRTEINVLYSTLGAYTTEDNLRLFFNSMNEKFNTNILFIKKRDDYFERLFTAFTMFKTPNGDVFDTNTLNMDIQIPEFDVEYEQSDAYILKPGHLFVYQDNSTNSVKMIDGDMSTDLSTIDQTFVYTNPFIIYFGKSPSIVGYYMNNIDARYTLDYTNVNESSIVQFIVGNIYIKRDAIHGSSAYKISISLIPSSELINKIVDIQSDGNVFKEALVVRLYIKENDSYTAFKDMNLTDWSIDDNRYTYSCELVTDDYITIDNRIRITNLYNIISDTEYSISPTLIDMMDCNIDIVTFYSYSESLPSSSTPIDHSEDTTPIDISSYINTNTYSSSNITFIKPLTMIRGTASYVYTGEVEEGVNVSNNYKVAINAVPLLSAKDMKDTSLSDVFYTSLNDQYTYLTTTTNISKLTTNSYSIDIKFYNTYGKSLWFTVGENDDLIDRVNISIHFKVKPTYGTNTDDLSRDIKIFIKEYIENIDDNGSNSFYVSNLIKELENKFDGIKYLQFMNINSFSSEMQIIENKSITDLSTLSKEERMVYVPEYLSISTDDIIIDMI